MSQNAPSVDFDPAMGRWRKLAIFRKKQTAISLILLTLHLAINFSRGSYLFHPFPYGHSSQERQRELAGAQKPSENWLRSCMFFGIGKIRRVRRYTKSRSTPGGRVNDSVAISHIYPLIAAVCAKFPRTMSNNLLIVPVEINYPSFPYHIWKG